MPLGLLPRSCSCGTARPARWLRIMQRSFCAQSSLLPCLRNRRQLRRCQIDGSRSERATTLTATPFSRPDVNEDRCANKPLLVVRRCRATPGSSVHQCSQQNTIQSAPVVLTQVANFLQVTVASTPLACPSPSNTCKWTLTALTRTRTATRLARSWAASPQPSTRCRRSACSHTLRFAPSLSPRTSFATEPQLHTQLR